MSQHIPLIVRIGNFSEQIYGKYCWHLITRGYCLWHDAKSSEHLWCFFFFFFFFWETNTNLKTESGDLLMERILVETKANKHVADGGSENWLGTSFLLGRKGLRLVGNLFLPISSVSWDTVTFVYIDFRASHHDEIECTYIAYHIAMLETHCEISV